ncbi:MAG TPA: N-acetylmuramoyl-L-alanine amidase [Methylomirabilota bacterium]|nr:N-acetylmuramoyl-L-alanine amidase [Methylomirabilota bacterium]
MRRVSIAGLLAVAALVGALLTTADGARPDAYDLRGRSGSLGQITLIGFDDGAAYVSAERLASLLKGTWTAKGSRGALTVGNRTAQFVKDQPRVLIQGQPVTLDAPPRLGAAGWLLPESFLTKGLGRLTPGTGAVAVMDSKRPKAVKASIPFEELRFRSYPSFTRVVVETGGSVSYAVVAAGQEIRVRLPGLLLTGGRTEEIADGLVKEVRLEPSGSDAVLRVVLESAAGEIRDSVLQDPFRLVLDIYRPKESGGIERGRGGMEPLRLVVLDAGHGGHDPGAIGPSGVMEKDVVLDVTRRVARMAEDGLGIKMVLTRSTDVFVPLRERTNFANKRRADLFVSIHANAHPRAVSEGVETYFLSSEASDSEARQTAAIENGVVQLESPASRQKGDVLKSILWDLAQSEFQQESSFMAETVLDSMTQSLKLVNRGVKQAGFYVLGGAAMPAILIEVGFLTNRKEEKKLATAEYREAVARAIYAGLAEYKRRYDQRLRTVQTLPARAEPTGKREGSR